MLACVKVITPVLTAVGTETITGIIDKQTGTPFRVRSMIRLNGYTPSNVLTHLSSGSAYHWDFGVMHDTGQGAKGGGDCFAASAKICSGADSYGYGFLDTQPAIFFGGSIASVGYITNVQLGQFDITWIQRDRTGESWMCLFMGDTDYEVSILDGVVNGTYTTPAKPQGILIGPAKYNTTTSGPAVTGAGGTGFQIGWDTRDGVRGACNNVCGNQGGNSRVHYNDRYGAAGYNVTSWGDTSYTVAGGDGGGGLQLIFCGAFVVTKAGKFSVPATDNDVVINIGLNARLVIVQTVNRKSVDAGTASGTHTEACVGFTDGLNHASYWTGESIVGNGPTPLGCRYLSTSKVIRTGFPNGAATTFNNIGAVTQLDSHGTMRFAFTNTDGTTPEVQWFAIGTARIPVTYSGLHYINPNKAQKHDSYNLGLEVKIPDPTIKTAVLGE